MSALSTLIVFLFSLFQLSTSTLFIAQGLTGFAIQIDIGPNETTVTAEVAANQDTLWHGIGFGRNKMRFSYAIIQHPTATFTERRLVAGDAGEELNPTASNWNVGIDTASDPYIITMTRVNDLGLSNKYYVFDPSLTQLTIIYAIGADSTFTNGHGAPTTTNPQYGSELIDETITTSPSTTPTANPSGTPTSNPSETPTSVPTATGATLPPSQSPSSVPTNGPIASVSPTQSPSSFPTATGATVPPSSVPTNDPIASVSPTQSPSAVPTTANGASASVSPSKSPSSVPTTASIAPSVADTTTSSNMSTTLMTTASATEATVMYTSEQTTVDSNDEGEQSPSDIMGYLARGQEWVNKEASQMQLLLVCGGFALILIGFLVCCYCCQNRKTRKLRKTLYQFDPELLQNERAKEEKQKAGANYNDIPYVDAQDPDSSIGNNHVMEEVAPPHEEAANAPPDDDEANFRRGNPNIPRDVANKLEESLSVSEEDLNMVHSLGDKALDLFTANMQGGGGGPAPPPPDEPIPQDILDAHNAQKAAIPAPAKAHVPSLFANKQQRNSYHPVSNVSGSVQEPRAQQLIELEQARLQEKAMVVNAPVMELERVKTQSHVLENDDDPPTPVSDDAQNELFVISPADVEDDKPRKPVHLPSGSLQTIANKRLSRSKSGNKSPQALMDNLIPLKDEIEMEQIEAPQMQSIEAQFKALSDRNLDNAMLAQFDDISDESEEEDKVIEPKTKHVAVQSGDDVILNMFSAETPVQQQPQTPAPDALEESLSVSSAGEEGTDEVAAKEEQLEAQHRGKQAEDDPFASLDVGSNEMFASAPPNKSKHGAVQSGDDVILDLFSANVAPKVEEVKPQQDAAQHRGKQAEDDPFASLDVDPNEMFAVQPQAQAVKPKDDAIQSGNDVILSMFSSDPAKDVAKQVEIVDVEPQSKAQMSPKTDSPPQQQHRGKQLENDPFASLDVDPNEMFAVAPPQAQVQPKHDAMQSGDDVILGMFGSDPAVEAKPVAVKIEHKEAEVDPFAALDVNPTEMFAVKENPRESEAMGFIGGLMAANPEFGDSENIFGVDVSNAEDRVSAIMNATGAQAMSHIVDFDKYANVPDTKPIDYSALTQISDTDQYKIVSVQETVTIEDADGNVKQMVTKADMADIHVISSNLDVIEAQLNQMEEAQPQPHVLDESSSSSGEEDEAKEEAEQDPFTPLNKDPFADMVSPLDEPFSSPLDALMNSANAQPTQEEEEEEEAFSSPLDVLMNEGIITLRISMNCVLNWMAMCIKIRGLRIYLRNDVWNMMC